MTTLELLVRDASDLAEGRRAIGGAAEADVALGSLWEGIEASGRERSAVKVCPSTNFHIGEDPGQAAEGMMRGAAALYVGGMGSREKNFYNAAVSRYGFEDAAKEVQDRLARVRGWRLHHRRRRGRNYRLNCAIFRLACCCRSA